MSELGEGEPVKPKESKAEKSAPERAKAAAEDVDEAAKESSNEDLVNKEKRNAAVKEVIAGVTPEFDSDPNPQERREAYLSAATTVMDDIGDRIELDDADVQRCAESLKGFNRVQVEKFLNGATKLNADTKEKVLSHFRMTDKERENAEKRDKMSPRQKVVAGKIADGLKSKAEETHDNMQAKLDEDMHEATAQKDYKKVAELTKRKIHISSMLNKIKDVFTDKEKGKEWAGKVGKTLYYLFIIMFLFIIWEMNALNKLGKSNR